MNICFVSNFEKTYVFDAVAKALLPKGLKVYWVVVNSIYYKKLIEDYPIESILYLFKGLKQINSECREDLKLNELVYNDRFLSKDLKEGKSFLRNAQSHIYNFIVENKIEAIFGEATWAHELLISRISNNIKGYKCPYYSPLVVRIPNEIFSFFEQENNDIDLDPNVSYEELDASIIKLEKPDYAKFNDNRLKESFSLKQRLKRVGNFISKGNVEKSDPSLLYDFNQRLNRGLLEEFNKTTYGLIRKTNFGSIKEKKYVVYTLHKQPEYSIDVLGRYYNDQLLLIRNIWQILPDGWLLVVKEHSNAIGDRKVGFYKKILTLPGLILVDEKCDSHQLIQNSEAVFTVSGTIAYEAALSKKTSFTFAPVFFNKLEYCHNISLDDLKNCRNLQELISKYNDKNHKKMTIKTFSNFVDHHTYSGIWNPTQKQVFSENNIEKLALAIVDILSKK